MYKRNRREVPQRERDGSRSSILLQQGAGPDTHLSVSWVEVPPGARQRLHHHQPEQVYVVVQGSGLMRVGDEEATVIAGDIIFLPPDVPHAIENRSREMLAYVSAATPAFDIVSLYDQQENDSRT